MEVGNSIIKKELVLKVKKLELKQQENLKSISTLTKSTTTAATTANVSSDENLEDGSIDKEIDKELVKIRKSGRSTNHQNYKLEKFKSTMKNVSDKVKVTGPVAPYLSASRSKKIINEIQELASKLSPPIVETSLPTKNCYSPTADSYRILISAAARQRGFNFNKMFGQIPMFKLGESPAYYLGCKKCKYRLRVEETDKGWCCVEVSGAHNHDIRLLAEYDSLKGKERKVIEVNNASSQGEIEVEDDDDEDDDVEGDEEKVEEEQKSDIEMELVVVASSTKFTKFYSTQQSSNKQQVIDLTRSESPRSISKESSPLTTSLSESLNTLPSTSSSTVLAIKERSSSSKLSQHNEPSTSSSSLNHLNNLPLASTSKRPLSNIDHPSQPTSNEINRTQHISTTSKVSSTDSLLPPPSKKSKLVGNSTSSTSSSTPTSRTPHPLATSAINLANASATSSLPILSISSIPILIPQTSTSTQPDSEFLKILRNFLHYLKPTLSNEKYVLFLYYSGITSKESIVNLLGLDKEGLIQLLEDYKVEDLEREIRGAEGVDKLPALVRAVLLKEIGDLKVREDIF